MALPDIKLEAFRQTLAENMPGFEVKFWSDFPKHDEGRGEGVDIRKDGFGMGISALQIAEDFAVEQWITELRYAFQKVGVS